MTLVTRLVVSVPVVVLREIAQTLGSQFGGDVALWRVQ